MLFDSNLETKGEQNKTKEYYQLLNVFTIYREDSIKQKETMKIEIQKLRNQLEKLTEKIEKKYQAKIDEDKQTFLIKFQKRQKMFKHQMLEIRQLLDRKDQTISELRVLLLKCEDEKRSIFEVNTKMLLDIHTDLELVQGRDQPNNSKSTHSYNQLLKMYQYLMEENCAIKKQIMIIQKPHLTDVKPEERNYKIKATHEQNSFKEQSFLHKSTNSKQIQEKDKVSKTSKKKVHIVKK